MMKKSGWSFLGSRSLRAVAGFALGLPVLLGTTTAHAQDAVRLLPYKGVIAGELLCTIDSAGDIRPCGQSEAWTRSSHLGVGVQRYNSEDLTIEINGDGRLEVKGLARTVAANGDELSTEFRITATTPFDPNNPFLEYEGIYWVLADGTGRFDYADDLGKGDLGAGVSEDGVAVLQPATTPEGGRVFTPDGMLFSLSFANSFEGTLAQSKPHHGNGKKLHQGKGK
jgi:hypothetical protein